MIYRRVVEEYISSKPTKGTKIRKYSGGVFYCSHFVLLISSTKPHKEQKRTTRVCDAHDCLLPTILQPCNSGTQYLTYGDDFGSN